MNEFSFRKDRRKHVNQCKTCLYEYLKKYKNEIQSQQRTLRPKKRTEKIDYKCKLCNKIKSYTEFQYRKDSKSYRYECKTCHKSNLAEYCKNVYNEKRRLKKKEDIHFKILCNHRNYVYKCLTKFKLKRGSSVDYIGCSISNLKQWLEYQFDEGMSWDNYGTFWTVDHVLPLSLFNFENESEQTIAFNWKNMRPSTDNFSKGNKLIMHVFFNQLVSCHRYLTYHQMTNEYKGLSESLNWLKNYSAKENTD